MQNELIKRGVLLVDPATSQPRTPRWELVLIAACVATIFACAISLAYAGDGDPGSRSDSVQNRACCGESADEKGRKVITWGQWGKGILHFFATPRGNIDIFTPYDQRGIPGDPLGKPDEWSFASRIYANGYVEHGIVTDGRDFVGAPNPRQNSQGRLSGPI
jgi:hypothetical protein